MRPSDVLKYELIGLHIEVADSQNRDLIGLHGKVVEETRNTLTIQANNKEKKLVKAQVTLATTIKGKKITINGALLVGKPEERLKKKFKE